MEFRPSNELEEVLVVAAKNPADHARRFLQLLLDAQVFLLTAPGKAADQGHKTFLPGEHVEFMTLEDERGPFIAMFSSREALQGAINQWGKTAGCLAMKASDAFGLLAQRPPRVILNPGLPYGRRFSAEDVRQLGRREIPTEGVRQLVFEKRTRVNLAEPKVYPHMLLDALKRVLVKHRSIEKAYMCWFHEPEVSDPPHHLIGLVGDYREALQSLVQAADTVLKGAMIDFAPIDLAKDSGLAAYFKSTKPFYERPPKPFWRLWGGP